jgi:hypothetical protein
MKKIESAFPDPHRIDMKGMSLRDYFAAKAMAAMMATDEGMAFNDVAMYAYSFADAMMKERAK